MSSIMENFQKRSFFPTKPCQDDLPISNPNGAHDKNCLRRRLSTFSVKIQPLTSSASAAATWSIRRTKSMSSIGELAGGSLRKWWDWGVGWFLSRKPTFAQDLEINEEESAMLGFHCKGSWRHVFYKVRSEFRRIIGSGAAVEKGFGYDSFSYAKNFDDGKRSED